MLSGHSHTPPFCRAQKHVGVFHLDNWLPLTEDCMVQTPGEVEAAVKRLRERGPNPNLNGFVDKLGLLHFSGAALVGDLEEVTGDGSIPIVIMNTRHQYTPTNDKVGYGTNAPTDEECNMATVRAALAQIFNDFDMLLGTCSSAMAREVACLGLVVSKGGCGPGHCPGPPRPPYEWQNTAPSPLIRTLAPWHSQPVAFASLHCVCSRPRLLLLRPH